MSASAELGVPRVDVDFEGLPWIIGPTEVRPYDEWLPQVREVMRQILDVPEDEPRLHDYLDAVLARFGAEDDHPLPYRMLRWLHLAEMPFIASFGLSQRGTDAQQEDFLRAVDAGPVEAPYIDELDDTAPGVTARRSVSYCDNEGGIAIEVRYLVDTGHPEVVAIVHAVTRDPGDLTAARADLDAFVRRLRVV